MASIQLVTRIGVLSYPNFDRPKRIDPSQPAKYGCALVLTPDKIDNLKEAILELAKGEFGPNALELLKTQQIRTPLRSGNEPKHANDPVYANNFFLNCYREESKGPPQLLKWLGAGQAPVPITDKAEIYAGCHVQLSVGLFSYKTTMNRGIGVGLNGVLLISPGKRLGGAVDATTAFAQAGVDAAEAEALQKANAAAAESQASNGTAAGAGASPW